MNRGEDTTTRPTVSDGKTAREIWCPEDGNGDADIKLYEDTQYNVNGHPTWKLYCGDAPELVGGVPDEPPKYCYLDDRAAHKILHWDGYTKAERGRFWRNDFSNKGDIRPHRKHRGRPGFVFGGDIAEHHGPSRKYCFSGAENSKDIAVINAELINQKTGRVMSRLLPCTSVVKPAEPPNVTPEVLKRLSSSLESQNEEDSSEFLENVRAASPITAGLENPQPFKKPRVDNIKATEFSLKAANKTIEELKTQIVILQKRNKTSSERAHVLTKENNILSAELHSTKTLWSATSKELDTIRTSYRESQDALNRIADGSVNVAALQAVKNDLKIYHGLAKHVYGKFQGHEETLEKGIAAIKGVKVLAQSLGVAANEVGMIDKEHDVIKRDLEEIRSKMKALVGSAEWGKFEREVLESMED